MRYLIKNVDGDDAIRGETVHEWVSGMTPAQQRALLEYRQAWYDPDTKELTGQVLSWEAWAVAAGFAPYEDFRPLTGEHPAYRGYVAGMDAAEWRRREDLRAKAKAIPFPKEGELSAQDKQRLLDQLGDPSNPNRRRLVQLSSIGTVERAYVPPGMETEALHNYLIDRGRVEEYVEYVMNTWMTKTQPMTAPDPAAEKLFSVEYVSAPKGLRATMTSAPPLECPLRDKSPSFLDGSGCVHEYNGVVEFDAEAAKGLEAEEVRQRWPRKWSSCRKCGEPCIRYASTDHYIAGDW